MLLIPFSQLDSVQDSKKFARVRELLVMQEEIKKAKSVSWMDQGP